MRIAIFGSTGSIGRQTTSELLERGHHVTALIHDPMKPPAAHERVDVRRTEVTDPEQVAAAVRDHDAVISAIGPSPKAPAQILVDAARALCAALPRAGVRRLIIVGGAGSLEVAPGTQLVDTPEFPAAWKAVALAHRDALAVYRGSDLDWTYVSPAALIQPGARLGRYRVGGDQLLVDEHGVSTISIPDFALAVVDELERGRHLRERVTFAY